MHLRFPFLLSSIPRQAFRRSLNPMGSKKMTSSGDSSDSPLSASDFRAYNRMAEQMEGFVSLSITLAHFSQPEYFHLQVH